MDHVSEIVLEVSAGVGGQEAMLFTKELLDMYVNFAEYRNWDYHIIGLDDSEIGAFKKNYTSIKITSHNQKFMAYKNQTNHYTIL